VGTGVFSNERDAVEKCVRIRDVLSPREEHHLKYAELFKTYLEIHDSLARIYNRG